MTPHTPTEDPTWQCEHCGGGFDDRPDACPDCGCERFRKVYLY